MTVYTSASPAAGKERDQTQWKWIASDKVLGQGDHRKTNVPVSQVIRAGRRMAFYLDTPSVFIPGPIRYSPSNIVSSSCCFVALFFMLFISVTPSTCSHQYRILALYQYKYDHSPPEACSPKTTVLALLLGLEWVSKRKNLATTAI